MKRPGVWILAGWLNLAAALAAAEESSWTKALADRAQRGKLQDAVQLVRGDSGRWNDEEQWLHGPAPEKKGARVLLDEAVEKWWEKKFEATPAADNWLLFRTRQLNDHDRVWIEKIERRGNQFTVVANQATWRGKYQKNFTYYQVLGVNLGRLEPGSYKATCLLRPTAFAKFDGTGQPQDNWPQDEQPADRKPLELSTTFSVVKGPR